MAVADRIYCRLSILGLVRFGECKWILNLSICGLELNPISPNSASVLGPLFGGLITTHSTWRWIFYINLPTCGIAIPALYFSLNLPARKRTTWSELARTFDFLGLVLIMAGCACLVVGFTNASDEGWGAKKTIVLLVVGFVLFCASIVNFLLTKRNAIIPPRILRNRTTVVWLICSTLHASSFLSASFYFPVFFQGVEGADPLMSGVSWRTTQS